MHGDVATAFFSECLPDRSISPKLMRLLCGVSMARRPCPPPPSSEDRGVIYKRNLALDFPAFHLDFFGNRLLIAVIAVTHVWVNHSLAVGAAPLITLLEWWGWRTGEPAWDRLAYRLLFICFVITTSLGAMTGVGIWLASSLVNPNAIGSLIRVFFFAWFTEWIIFCTEVLLIVAYFLTWKRWTPRRKGLHIALGASLAIFSWLTMAIIVAILGFMMDTGNWADAPSFLHGVFNPIYLPQLAFRTPLAMVTAGLFGLMVLPFVLSWNEQHRPRAVRFLALWTGAWLPLSVAGAIWYWQVIPESMLANADVALATQAWATWYDRIVYVLAGSVVVIALVTAWGAFLPRRLPRVAAVVPFLLALALLGYFERFREFVRKPYVIEDYMYANGICVDDYPLLAEEGVLRHAAYVRTRSPSDAHALDAGRDMFLIACSRCHTTRGINSVTAKLETLFGASPWDPAAIKPFLAGMHNSRPFMPPVPGTDQELEALTKYLCALQVQPHVLQGAQSRGIDLPLPDGAAGEPLTSTGALP